MPLAGPADGAVEAGGGVVDDVCAVCVPSRVDATGDGGRDSVPVAAAATARPWLGLEASGADADGRPRMHVANRMALHQSTTSNMVDRLETSGLIRKERTSADQRVVRLYLTDEGLALLARAPSPARGVLPEALRLMDDEGLASLQSELEKLLRQIKNLDEGFGMQPLPFTE